VTFSRLCQQKEETLVISVPRLDSYIDWAKLLAFSCASGFWRERVTDADERSSAISAGRVRTHKLGLMFGSHE